MAHKKKKSQKKFSSLFLVVMLLMLSVLAAYLYETMKSRDVLGDQTESYRYVSPAGSDSNPGTENSPWKTMDFAIKSLRTGNTLFVRAGEYETIEDAWRFTSSGTNENPIVVRNYPGEQAIFKINSTRMERRAFRCMYDPNNPSPRQPSPANYIRLIGSDLSSPKTLSNGVSSAKGLVVLGIRGANAVGIESIGPHCNNWEVAGFDFIETGGGIFQRNGPSQHWDVHDNRVYNFYRESGMQFNGHNNTIYNNEIYLVNSESRTYGCQMINLLGYKNTVRNNILSRAGSTHRCLGVLFEWDLADRNLIENNRIEDVPVGIGIQGGDRNIIRNNIIRASNGSADAGVNIRSYDNVAGWPCNETSASFRDLLPPNDPSHSAYEYFYNPRNCHSMYNEISNNTITGFRQTYSVEVPENTNIFINNSGSSNPTPPLAPTPTTRPPSSTATPRAPTPTTRPPASTTTPRTPTPTTRPPSSTATPTSRPSLCTPKNGTWQYGDWSKCNAQCGGGLQTRTATCIHTACGGTCPNNPTTIKMCNAGDCTSTISVYVAGSPYKNVYPTIELLIDDVVVKQWTNIKGLPLFRFFQKKTFVADKKINIHQIKIRLANDTSAIGNAHPSATKKTLNVMVDKIVLDGKKYEMESEDVYSTGTWTNKDTSCTPGFKKAEWLHCDGYFSIP